MKRLLLLLLLAVGVVAILLWWRLHTPPDPQAAAASALLRQKILTREFISEAGPGQPGVPRYVLMDWNIGRTVATLVAADDGSTSLYLSSGGGFIGAGRHDRVRAAASEFRALAATLTQHFQPTDTFPLAPARSVIFYIVTDSATLTSGPVRLASVDRGDPPFSNLQRLAQNVITEIRRAT